MISQRAILQLFSGQTLWNIQDIAGMADVQPENPSEGKNNKPFLICLKTKGQNPLSDGAITMLQKLIQAVGLTTADTVQLQTSPGQKIPFSALIRQYPARHALFFGLTPADLGLQFHLEPYTALQFKNVYLLFADDIEQLKDNQALKKSLWKELKRMFNLES